jgi:hypothetical protein
VPEDLSAPHGVLDSEKAVIKVINSSWFNDLFSLTIFSYTWTSKISLFCVCCI